MKITTWQPKAPRPMDDLKEDFARRLCAFRAATGRPEQFVSRCACAIHDKGFTIVYERPDPARPFVLTGIYKDGESEAPASAGPSRSRTLSAAEVNHAGWRCPYCSSNHHIACQQCKTTVCGGKTRRYPGTQDIFQCRVSCGGRGTLTDALTVEGVEPSRKRSGMKPISERLPAPGADTLRLGGVKVRRLK